MLDAHTYPHFRIALALNQSYIITTLTQKYYTPFRISKLNTHLLAKVKRELLIACPCARVQVEYSRSAAPLSLQFRSDSGRDRTQSTMADNLASNVSNPQISETALSKPVSNGEKVGVLVNLYFILWIESPDGA